MNIINSITSAISKNNTVRFTLEVFGFSNYPRIIKYFQFPFIFLKILFRRMLGRNDISKIDFVITTRCTLKCKHCSNLMQFYGEDTLPASDYETDDLCADINKLLDLTDRIWQLVLVGGEPLINKDLAMILGEILPYKKIKMINIVTNGTIIPNNDLICVLQNPKIQVTVSDYGDVAKNKDKVLETLRNHHIKYKVLNSMTWVDRGEIKKRGRATEELVELFSSCISKCTTLMGGKIYSCEVYSNGANLGYIEESESEVIDIRNINKNDFSDKLEQLNARKCIHACDYCGEVTYSENNTVKAGIQM